MASDVTRVTGVQAILATLGYVLSPDRRRVLMIRRDAHFLPLVFADRPRVFHSVMPFRNGRAVSWSYTEL
jgi:hypothetical protein